MDEPERTVPLDLFTSIRNDVSHLHMYWKIYRQLYAHGEQRIDLLNETGSMVFSVLQHLLLDEVTLAIGRLTDPSATGKKANHSLARLVESVQHAELSTELRVLLEKVGELAKPFRDRRNRAIAHSDLTTKLEHGANPLPGVSREKVEEMLKEIRALLNAYDRHYHGNTMFYEDPLLPLGSDGDFLCQQLRRAVAFRDLEREGKIDRKLWTEGRYKDA